MAYEAGKVPKAPQPPHAILHYLRGSQESRHRYLIHGRSTDPRWIYQPNISDLAYMAAEMTLQEANDCCNKAAPLYIFSAKRTIYPSLFVQVLHNYLYHKWFIPYKSEIEYLQFVTKTFLPELLPDDLQPGPLVNLAIPVHAAICVRAQEARDAVKELEPPYPLQPIPPKGPKKRGHYKYARIDQIVRDQEFFLLRPLFRAIMIIIRLEEYNDEDLDVRQLPVLLVRTGIEEDLSAPISFEPIAHKIKTVIQRTNSSEAVVQVTLETAVDFVMSMDKREIATFGHQPDPILSTRNLGDGGLYGPSILTTAQEMGWGDEELRGPSSKWVDTERYPEWSGGGAHEDHMIRRMEDNVREDLRMRKEVLRPWPEDNSRGKKHWNIY
ncbi:hypothetical protein T069G_04307 [Trichoderma breve]|uniref:Uncharacterized protein n=1 Tax=Trichoderma breve TaxID=2034170 RepID=A0A9W9JPI1_9HYPO|nr:hypothetical protein T069G_04307 [Trichoderma breve]KAJ4863353.1 hypothetical protein T069G_04307 [Trichoderma breve]